MRVMKLRLPKAVNNGLQAAGSILGRLLHDCWKWPLG